MASRLANLSQASEVSQIRSPGEGGGEKQMRLTLNDLLYKYGNSISRIVDIFGNRLTIIPTNN